MNMNDAFLGSLIFNKDGGGPRITKIVSDGVLCSSGTFHTVAIPNYANYTYLYIWVTESNLSYKFNAPNSYCACYKSSEIGTGIRNGLWLGYFRDSTTHRYNLTRSGTSINMTPTDIYNKPNVWVDVYGCDEQIFS